MRTVEGDEILFTTVALARDWKDNGKTFTKDQLEHFVTACGDVMYRWGLHGHKMQTDAREICRKLIMVLILRANERLQTL